MKNWCCRPASEAEAIEIVERAVANGAVASDLVEGMSGGVERYYWNEYSHWGVLDGYTHANVAKRWSGAEDLTIQQVREQFPLPHEVNDMSDKKECQGQQDWWPPVGTVCELWWGGIYNDDVEIIQYRKNGNKVVFWRTLQNCADAAEIPTAQFRPLRTEREKWIEQACKVFHAKCFHDYSGQHFTEAMGAVYDNMIKEAE